MRFGKDKLWLVKSPLVAFTVDGLFLLGSIFLLVTVGARPQQTTKVVKFMVIDFL